MNDELVEALARNIFDLEDGSQWDRTTDSMRNAYRDSIRKALEATLPNYAVKVPISTDMVEDLYRGGGH